MRASLSYHNHAVSGQWRRRRAWGRTVTAALLVLLGGVGCNDLSGLAGKQPLPSGIPDQATTHTRNGALALYNTALCQFMGCGGPDGSGAYSQSPFVQYALESGLLTDELQAGNLGGTNQSDYTGSNAPKYWNQLDTRQLPIGVSDNTGLYTQIQAVRNVAGLAIGALAAYDTVDSPALRGQMYALQGYSELLLADLYCSGVPLSILQFQGDFLYKPGSTTQQLYAAAIAKFDTALTLSGDSANILNLARVGRGRAYLALGTYDSAAAAVASVPTSFSYQFAFGWDLGSNLAGGIFANNGGMTMADSEGTVGLPYRTSGDPRTAGASFGANIYGVAQYAPVKYGGAALASGTTILPVVVASGIEARLIQAEAAYHGVATGTGSWLDQLNALRQAYSVPGSVTDPGTVDGQVKLLFHERAFWLYLTGERQGDLRRLIRNYGYDQSQVYPSGSYPLFGVLSAYGTDVTVPVPTAEQSNPLFTGCLSRGA